MMERQSEAARGTTRGRKFNSLIDDCHTLIREQARRFVERSPVRRVHTTAARPAYATPALTSARGTRTRNDDDPLTFLLDSVSDAVNLWSADGQLLYRNRASGSLHAVFVPTAPSQDRESEVEKFALLGRSFERRYLRCHIERQDYYLEVIRDVR